MALRIQLEYPLRIFHFFLPNLFVAYGRAWYEFSSALCSELENLVLLRKFIQRLMGGSYAN
jgi:hypothetical protein